MVTASLYPVTQHRHFIGSDFQRGRKPHIQQYPLHFLIARRYPPITASVLNPVSELFESPYGVLSRLGPERLSKSLVCHLMEIDQLAHAFIVRFARVKFHVPVIVKSEKHWSADGVAALRKLLQPLL